jgi:hypothetical protein
MDRIRKQTEILMIDKANLEKKLVSVETDNNDLLNKAREFEHWSDELRGKLDAALEENIILHNEAETYKAESEEAMQRLQEEMDDLKNEVTSKDKIINRLTMHRDFLLKSSNNAKDDGVIEQQFNTLRASGSFAKLTGSVKIPERFMQSYSKTFLNVVDNNTIIPLEKKYSEDIGNSLLRAKGSFGGNDSGKDDGEEDTEFIRQKIDAEIKNILDNRRNFILNTLSQENFCFDYIGTSDRSGGVGRMVLNKKSKVQNMKLVDDMLAKVQERKEKIIAQRKLMQVKLEKVGVRII